MKRRTAIFQFSSLGIVGLTAWTAALPAGLEQAAPLPVYENVAAYSNLNAAMAAAVAKGVSGVRIPAKTTITARGPVSLPSGFAVVGDNPETSRVVFKTMAPAGFLLSGVTGVVMRGFTLDGGSVDMAGVHVGSGFAVGLGACERVTLEDLVFVKMPSIAILQSSGTRSAFVRLARCRFLDGKNSSVRGGGDHWIIMNNEFRRTGGIGVGGEGHIIIGNVFDDLNTVAIQTAGLTRSLVAHNVVPRSTRDHGIFQSNVAPNDGNVYAYNHILNTGMVDGKEEENGSASGFQTWKGGNNLVVGNLFKGTAGYGINDCGNILPQGNVSSDNIVCGAIDPGLLVNLSDMAVIRRNRICHNRSIGAHLGCEVPIRVRVQRGGHGCWFVNNVVRDNSIPGVWALFMTEGLIQGNRILDNGRNPGIWPPGLREITGRTGLCISWAPNFVGDNEFAFNRIIGNTIGDTRADPNQKTQWYGIQVGDVRTNFGGVKMMLDPNDRWSFRNNTICWNDLRGNRETAIYYAPGVTGRDQTIHHNATNEATAAELDGGPALADAGPSLVVAGGSTVRLTAKHTRCPKGVDPTSLRYEWRAEEGRPERSHAWTNNTPSPIVSFPSKPGLEIYGFVLRVTRTDAQGTNAGEYTEDKVFVATYNDGVCGPRLPATFDKELALSPDGPEGFSAVPFTPTNGWQWSIRGGELAARLDGTNGGGVRLVPDGKIFGQVASADMACTNQLPAGMSAGLVLANGTGADRPADGYFLGLHRGAGEAEASLKAIRLMGLTATEFAGLAAGDARVLHQGRWDGKRLQLSVQRVGDVYTFLVNGAAVAKNTQNLLEEPYYDGPVPTLVALQVLATAAVQAEVCFDNLAIDHAASPPAIP